MINFGNNLTILLLVSFIITNQQEINHTTDYIDTEKQEMLNIPSPSIEQSKPSLDELYDSDEFDTTGVDITSLDLKNVNNRNLGSKMEEIKPSIDSGIKLTSISKSTTEKKDGFKEKEDEVVQIADNNINPSQISNLPKKLETNYERNLESRNTLDEFGEIGGPRSSRITGGKSLSGGYRHSGENGYIGGRNNPIGGSASNNFQNFNNNNNNKGYFQHLNEMIMIFFFIMFFYNMICGKTNYRLTQNWFEANKDFIKKNYKRIGMREDLLAKMMKRQNKGIKIYREKNDKKIKKVRKIFLHKKKEVKAVNNNKEKKTKLNIFHQSTNLFKFFAFNRSNVKCLIVNFEFNRSSDYFSLFSGNIFHSERDRCYYQIALNVTDDIPSVFCLCRNVEAKSFKKSYDDINFFTKPYQPSFLSNYHLLFAESSQIFIDIFRNKNLMTSFKKIEQYLEIIYFSDRKTFTLENYGIFFGFDLYLDQYGAKQIYKDINDFVHLFIDELCIIDIPEKIRREAANNRIEFEDLKSRRNQTSTFQQMNHQNENFEQKNEFQEGRIFKRKLRSFEKNHRDLNKYKK